ncbi:hypothetical protein EDB89DRAFT_1906309 [Lactarius sanguifluus]|nr:hypothetical protein EDB89DRAFT_1906309 [Lactarius sanguifluus]
MAVADAVAALAGCWRRLVVFVQLEAVSADLRHVVVESRVVVAMYENGNHRAGVEKVASHRPRWLPTLNVQDYDNHKPRQRTVPNTTRTAVPTTTTTQRAAAATTTTHRRQFIVHPQRQRHQTSTASDDTSSNDDYDDAIDGDSGSAITRRATAVTRMRWRGDGYSRREYECQLGKLGEYSLSRVLAAASTSRVRWEEWKGRIVHVDEVTASPTCALEGIRKQLEKESETSKAGGGGRQESKSAIWGERAAIRGQRLGWRRRENGPILTRPELRFIYTRNRCYERASKK